MLYYCYQHIHMIPYGQKKILKIIFMEMQVLFRKKYWPNTSICNSSTSCNTSATHTTSTVTKKREIFYISPLDNASLGVLSKRDSHKQQYLPFTSISVRTTYCITSSCANTGWTVMVNIIRKESNRYQFLRDKYTYLPRTGIPQYILCRKCTSRTVKKIVGKFY